MRLISLFLTSLLLCCYAAETDTSVSQAVAVKVASVMKKQEDAIKVANDVALKELRKMLVTYKKDKNACVLIAIKINKLDKTDKDAIELIKDIPPESQDLLGQVGDPGKYISEIKAKLIVDALAKNKFTEADWNTLAGKIVTIEDSKDRPLQIGSFSKGVVLIVPNPNDRWNKCSYKGDGAFNQLQGLFEKTNAKNENEKETVFTELLCTIPEQGTLSLYCFASGGAKPKGSIRVKIYEVVPLE